MAVRRWWPSLVLVVLAASAMATWWGQASWRVEATDDGVVCGLERDLTGWPLEGQTWRGLSKVEACNQLASLPDRCPVVARAAREECKSLLPKEDAAKLHRIHLSLRPRKREVLDSGWPAYVGERLRVTGSSMRNVWQRLTSFVTMIPAPGYSADAKDLPVLFLSNPRTCLGTLVRQGHAYYVVTSGHCLGEGVTAYVSTQGCSNGSSPIKCTRVDPEVTEGCEKPQGIASDMAVCRVTQNFCGLQNALPMDLSAQQSGSVWVVGSVDGGPRRHEATVAFWPTQKPNTVGAVPVAASASLNGGGTLDNNDSGGAVIRMGSNIAPTTLVGTNGCGGGNVAHIAPVNQWAASFPTP